MEIQPLVDIHTHMREPGQCHKETIETASKAALAGGYGACLAMPNTLPPIDSPEMVRWVLQRAKETAKVKVYTAAAVTVGQKGKALTDFAALKEAGASALSDDGYPVSDDKIMREALIEAKRVGLPVMSHCEPETELAKRDIALAEETGCPVHICHVSLKKTVEALREAKAKGIPVTAETCPHYMVSFAEGKMNPPLASEEDVSAVLEGLRDGTIDAIATDHAPHSTEEKNSSAPPNGVTGLETALSIAVMTLYEVLGMEGIMKLMRDNPARILGITPPGGRVVLNVDKFRKIGNSKFSKSSNSPFLGMELKGEIVSCQLTD